LKQKNKRPRFLKLWQIQLPLIGIVSIIHRISGVVMMLLFPFLLYQLQLSLSSAEGFARARAIVDSWPLHILALIVLWLFAHHFFAGIRVLLIDMEWGSDLLTARRSARLVMIAALLVAIWSTML
jgi:succinate dehydrogenase / fumarate reductase cytochrome b subunit